MPARVVTGYHGTTVDGAQRMLAGPLQDSGKVPRWLGAGIYFFEHNFEAATYWARIRAVKAGTAAAVVKAEIELHSCLDLTVSSFQAVARNAHRTLQAEWLQDETKRVNQQPFEIHLDQV